MAEQKKPVRMLTKLPAKNKYQFCKQPTIEGVKDFEALKQIIVRRAETLLEEIEEKASSSEEKREIAFRIGKTFAPKNKLSNKWRIKGIEKSWQKMKTKGYDFLLAFVVITRKNVPENAVPPFNRQQSLALALESQLLHHFCFVKGDERMEVENLHIGQESLGYAGQVLFLAVRYKDMDDEKGNEVVEIKKKTED